MVRIILVTDDWDLAGKEAERLWMWQHRRCGRELVRVWNQMYPDKPVRTTCRFLVFEETTH
jgi:hypothetical protein